MEIPPSNDKLRAAPPRPPHQDPATPPTFAAALDLRARDAIDVVHASDPDLVIEACSAICWTLGRRLGRFPRLTTRLRERFVAGSLPSTLRGEIRDAARCAVVKRAKRNAERKQILAH